MTERKCQIAQSLTKNTSSYEPQARSYDTSIWMGGFAIWVKPSFPDLGPAGKPTCGAWGVWRTACSYSKSERWRRGDDYAGQRDTGGSGVLLAATISRKRGNHAPLMSDSPMGFAPRPTPLLIRGGMSQILICDRIFVRLSA